MREIMRRPGCHSRSARGGRGGSPGRGAHTGEIVALASQALADWQSRLADRLNSLLQIHLRATGSGRGRRWGTHQFNGQLFVALVGQFQGFARALHDEAVDWLLDHGPVAAVLADQAVVNRQLDKGSPHPGALAGDFGRLGLDLNGQVRTTSRWGSRRLHRLDRAVRLRNGIAHDDPAGLAQAAAGAPSEQAVPSLNSFRVHRRALDRLAVDMDRVVARHLGSLTGARQPW